MAENLTPKKRKAENSPPSLTSKQKEGHNCQGLSELHVLYPTVEAAVPGLNSPEPMPLQLAAVKALAERQKQPKPAHPAVLRDYCWRLARAQADLQDNEASFTHQVVSALTGIAGIIGGYNLEAEQPEAQQRSSVEDAHARSAPSGCTAAEQPAQQSGGSDAAGAEGSPYKRSHATGTQDSVGQLNISHERNYKFREMSGRTDAVCCVYDKMTKVTYTCAVLEAKFRLLTDKT